MSPARSWMRLSLARRQLQSSGACLAGVRSSTGLVAAVGDSASRQHGAGLHHCAYNLVTYILSIKAGAPHSCPPC